MLHSLWVSTVQEASRQAGSKSNRWSVWRSNTAPPSELIVPPSKRATISRDPQSWNPKLDCLHSVIAKAVPPWLQHVVADMFMPKGAAFCYICREKSGLSRQRNLG